MALELIMPLLIAMLGSTAKGIASEIKSDKERKQELEDEARRTANPDIASDTFADSIANLRRIQAYTPTNTLFPTGTPFNFNNSQFRRMVR